MFEVNETTKQITMHRGNTGDLTISFTGYDFSEVNAKALFCLKRAGTEVKNEVHDIVNNKITIHFANEDTDWLSPGVYEYDVTVVIDPVITDGQITSGNVVYTTEDPIPANIKRTVGQV